LESFDQIVNIVNIVLSIYTDLLRIVFYK